MGSMFSADKTFTEQELDDYEALTYLSKKEILHIFKKFREIDPDTIGENKMARISSGKLQNLPELLANPFRERICLAFSSADDGSGDLNFEDFLDMLSVFSDACPKSVKIDYAFRIYDFNGDDKLDDSDLRELIKLLTKGLHPDDELKDEELDQLVKNIMREADLDGDNLITFTEFEHMLSKAPDFVNAFRIKL